MDARKATIATTWTRRRHGKRLWITAGLVLAFSIAELASGGTAERWVVVQQSHQPDGPAVTTAEVRNAEGFTFSLYETPGQDLHWRVALPDASETRIDADAIVTLVVGEHSQVRVLVAPSAQRQGRFFIADKAFDIDESRYLPGNIPARMAYWLQTGAELKLTIQLKAGATLATSFTLAGARSAIAAVVGPFTPEYDAGYRQLEAQLRQHHDDQHTLDVVQHAAEGRCGVDTSDQESACAGRIRACIRAHDADVLPPEEALALRHCLEAVMP